MMEEQRAEAQGDTAMSEPREFFYEDDDGLEHTALLQTCWEVCWDCDGNGKHSHPAFRNHGISAEEWERDWDYEEREAYLSGAYDVPCGTCKGRRVVAEVDTDQLSPEMRKRWHDHLEDEARYQHMVESERRYGA